MKKCMWMCVVAMLFVVGCSKYKTFNEEAASLNTEYTVLVQDIFKQQNKNERQAALQQFQQRYDEAFADIAKRWKVSGSTAANHIDFQKLFCSQTVQEPYEQKIEEIVNKYKDDFAEAFTTMNSEKMNDVAKKAGVETGTLNALYEKKARAVGCSVTVISGSELVERMTASI